MGLKEVRLDPVGSIGLLCVPSFAVMALLVLTGVLPSGLASAKGADIALFAVVQGLGVGLCAGLLYAFAIRRLGAERSSVFGSLSPVAVVLLAVPLLHESPTPSVLVGVPVITAGVVLANRRRAAGAGAPAGAAATGAPADAPVPATADTAAPAATAASVDRKVP